MQYEEKKKKELKKIETVKKKRNIGCEENNFSTSLGES